VLPLTRDSLLVLGFAGDDSPRSTKLSLKSARECARNGWLVGVVGRHNGQHAAESSNERALHCVNTWPLQKSQQSICFTYNEHETPAGGDVGVSLGCEDTQDIVVLELQSAIVPSQLFLQIMLTS